MFEVLLPAALIKMLNQQHYCGQFKCKLTTHRSTKHSTCLDPGPWTPDSGLGDSGLGTLQCGSHRHRPYQPPRQAPPPSPTSAPPPSTPPSHLSPAYGHYFDLTRVAVRSFTRANLRALAIISIACIYYSLGVFVYSLCATSDGDGGLRSIGTCRHR